MHSQRCTLLLVFLSVSGIFASPLQQDSEDDTIYRAIFNDILGEIVASSGTQLKVKDIDESFGNFFFGGRLQASGGVFGDLSTLNLRSISVKEVGNAVLIDAEISLDVLEITFDHFEVDFSLLTTTGSISATVDENLLQVEILATFTDNGCSVELLGATFEDFGDLNITSLKVDSVLSDSFVLKVLKMLESRYKDRLVSIAEARLGGILNPYLQSICNHV